MKQRWRPGQKKNAGCPEWILAGIKKIHQQAVSRGRNEPLHPSQVAQNAQIEPTAEKQR